jgi:hypothetical protein
MNVNDNLILLGGKSATGKSASLMNLNIPEGVMYLNCEAGKKLPFPTKFKQATVTDPNQVPAAFKQAETMPEIHTIVVDSLTYLLDMYESNYVLNSANTMKAWGDFAQYFKNLMQVHVAQSTKNVIFLAHTLDSLNEGEMIMETKVPVKGALKNNGIESYFSCVIASKKVPLTALEKYQSTLLTITEEEESLGLKYVYQTRVTKETVNERLRGPMGLFGVNETFTDNNMQLILDRLHDYYND